MYGCESWPIKKTDHWRIDAFKLWCWRRLLRFPRTARRSNPSILKDINSKYSLEGLMLKLTSQYYHLMWWADSWIKTLMLWKTEGRRRLSLYGQARTVSTLEIFSGLSTMSIFLLKSYLPINDCFCVCVHRVCLRVSTYWARWAGCGSHAIIVLSFRSTFCASLAWFCC